MEFDPFVKFILEKVDRMKTERGWSVYKLAQESGINPQTIHNWFERGAVPTLRYLYDVCRAFGITLSEFFAENKIVEVSPVLADLYDLWCCLTPDEKTSVEAILKNYAANKR
jgi:transcriptional regulator with XRE-family HTH domain